MLTERKAGMVQKKVAVLIGGWSVERDVSLTSGKSIITAIETLGHRAIPIDVTQNLNTLLSALDTHKPDVIFNALHGKGGEDGVIQGVLEFLNVPYTHSGVAASAVAMNKVLARHVFTAVGLPVPVSGVFSLDFFKRQHPFPLPYVVKPLSEGSSKGVYIVQTESDRNFVLTDWTYGPTLLVEKFIKGREIQVAMMGDTPLGAIEIRPRTAFYDYEAKYTHGKADHLMPAPLGEKAYDLVLELTKKAHQALGCTGITRTDFMYDEEANEFYLLELNTQPGFTPLSLVPEIAAHYGISFENLVQWILTDAENRFLALDAPYPVSCAGAEK